MRCFEGFCILTVDEIAFRQRVENVRLLEKACGGLGQIQCPDRIPETRVFGGGIQPGQIVEYVRVFRIEFQRGLVGLLNPAEIAGFVVQIAEHFVKVGVLWMLFDLPEDDFFEEVAAQLFAGLPEVEAVADRGHQHHAADEDQNAVSDLTIVPIDGAAIDFTTGQMADPFADAEMVPVGAIR